MYRLAALALVLIATLTGCWSLHDAAHPIFLSGTDAQGMIDRSAGNELAALHPDVPVGPSTCGFLLDLTGKRTARCTLPVAGRRMRVDVTAILDMNFPILVNVDALIVKRSAERQIAQRLTLRYGITFAARCAGEPVRVVPVKTPIDCAVSAPGVRPRTLSVFPSDRKGTVGPIALRGVDTRAVRMLGRSVATRRTDGVIAGQPVERYLRAIAGADEHDDLVRLGLLGAAHCPRRIAVTSHQPGSCRVRVGNATIRYDLRFDRLRGFIAEANDTVIVVAVARDMVRNLDEHVLRLAGTPQTVRVDCGREPVVVLDSDDSLPCTARARGGTKHFAVEALGDEDDGLTVSQRE